MPIKQSAYFRGNARTPVPVPDRKGQAIEYLFTHTFTEDVNTNDVLELIPVFPYGRITGFDFASENLGAVNLTMGLVSGESGSLDPARTCGSQLLNAAAAGTPAPASLASLAALPAMNEKPVSIGLVPSANIVAGGTKRLHIRIRVAS